MIDSKKAALMKTETVLPLLNDKSIKIKWGKSASEITQDALDRVSQFIGTHFVSYNIEKAESEFIEAITNAIKTGKIIRTQITPDNLKSAFDKWVDYIGKEIWKAYFAMNFPYSIREKFKLGRGDVGWYQIRHALKTLSETGEYVTPFSFASFEEAYAILTEKLKPQVYELGFLKV